MDGFITNTEVGRPFVVIVEDDNGVRRSLQLLLQGHGFDVRAYASPEALLADPQAARADCILADYRLTAMDGIAMLGRLRMRGWGGAAILMTAFGSHELTARAKSAGFADVFQEPFKDHILITALKRLAVSTPSGP